MPYTDIGGIRHYYEVHGTGEPLLLLHGGFCTLETMTAQIGALAASHSVHAPERVGHGRTADRDGSYSFASMAAETVAFLDALGIADAHVVGFSDGAIIGLLLALDHPQRVRSLVAISGCLDPGWYVDRTQDHAGDGTDDSTDDDTGDSTDDDTGDSTGDSTGDDRIDDDSDEPAEGATPSFPAFQEAYDRLSPDPPGHGAVVLEKLLALWRVEPQIDPAALARVAAPTLVMAGDRDSISTTHTVDIAAAIPGAQLCIVPDASHMVMQERPDLVNQVLAEFLAGVRSVPESVGH